MTAAAAANTPPMIELRGLTKAFGRKAVLRGLDLKVARGDSLVLFGPNGAGKTTLIRILAGLSRPTAGMAMIDGLDMAVHAQSIRRFLGVVSHAPLLYDDLTGDENLRFYARLYEVGDAPARIAALLDKVGLTRRRHDLVRTYSRGMVQRLAIARALLHDPLILLLDEPDTGLDPQAAEMLHDLLQQVGSSRTRTTVTVTHSIERGLAIGDRVAILVDGRLAFESSAAGMSPAEFRGAYDRLAGSGR